MRLWGLLLVLLLVGGCTEDKTNYVCPDGGVVADPSLCQVTQTPSSEISLVDSEKEIFDKVNRIRESYEAPVLEWNEKIADVARKRVKEQATGEYFAHTSPSGKDVFDDLNEAKIFYSVASENLYYMEGDDTTTLADSSVEGWMKSPGHKSSIVDFDKHYNEAGVGVYCDGGLCYVAIIFAGRWDKDEIELWPHYSTFFLLYDPAYPFDFDVSAKLIINSSEVVNVYFVPSEEEWDKFTNGEVINYFESWKGKKDIDEYLEVKKGEGLLIENSDDKSAAVSVEVHYLEELDESKEKSTYEEESPFLVNDEGKLGGRMTRTYGPFEITEPTALKMDVATDGKLSVYVFPSEKDMNNWLNWETYSMYIDCWMKWIEKSSSKVCGVNGTVYVTVSNRLEGKSNYNITATKDKINSLDISPLEKKYPSNQ